MYFLRCGALWGSFQYEKEALVEHMNDLESDMATFTTTKASSAHKAEEKCLRYKVSCFGRLDNPVLFCLFVLSNCY